MGFPYVDTIAKRSDGPGENDLLRQAMLSLAEKS